MVADSQAALDSDKLVSELNIYFQRQLEFSIDDVIFKNDSANPPADIVESYFEEKKLKASFLESIQNEDVHDKTVRLAYEYDCLNLKNMAEKRFKDMLIGAQKPTSDQLYKFMCYDLRQGNFVRAEESLWKIEDPPAKLASELMLVKACIYLRRGLNQRALAIIEDLIQGNKFTPLHNTFMAFLYTFYFDRPKLGKKYFAVSQRVKLRQMGLLPPLGTKQDAKSQEKQSELSEKDQDDLWMELAAFFCNYCFIELCEFCLTMIRNQTSYQILAIKSSLEYLKGDIDKADEILNQMSLVSGGSKKAEVFMLKATNAFSREYYYEAEELIYSALKLNPNLNDFTTLLRLGYIYLNRRSFEDAQATFYTACNLNSKSALSWLGLGISCFRLGEQQFELYLRAPAELNSEEDVQVKGSFDRQLKCAESALRMANIFDPTNSDVWCYSILLSLKDQRKQRQAVELLKYLLDLEVENLQLLLEVVFILYRSANK